MLFLRLLGFMLASAFAPSRIHTAVSGLSWSLRSSAPGRRLVRARSSLGARTRYTIDDTVCPPTRPHLLESAVTKTCTSIDTFLRHRPIANHTKQAFDVVSDLIDTSKPVILDSGCGTGRSTRLLGTMYPDHVVIGVDRSFVRLSKQQQRPLPQEHSDTSALPALSTNLDTKTDAFKRQLCETLSDNAFIVRAELVDFWICARKQNWNIKHHFLLYPNPNPKLSRLTQRWYAHPSFPLILALGSDTITIRSNWEGYLIEFAKSVEIAANVLESTNSTRNWALPYLDSARMGPTSRSDKRIAWTNFEQKYDNVGEPTYELKLVLSR